MTAPHNIRGSMGSDWELAPLDRLSLYVHIPFCTSRCRYCNFYFETGWSPRILKNCLDTILRQSEAWQRAMTGPASPRIHTVYLGGGTPSVVPPELLDNFLKGFGAIWGLGDSPPLEFAMEANPESLSQGLLEVLARHGVNRLSLGIQSLDSQALATLGRRAGRADAERAAVLLGHARDRGLWKGLVNMDLITGIPGQTAQSLDEDLSFVLDHGADHVSVYSLTVEPGTSLEQLFDLGQSRPVDSEAHEALWDQADARLEAAGLRNYEVSNFARPGCESRHNLSYWNLLPYAGLGPGATGTLPGWLAGERDRGEAPRPLRTTGARLFEYARPGSAGTLADVEAPTPGEFFIDHLLTGFRTEEGLDLDRLGAIFGPSALLAMDRVFGYWAGRGFTVKEVPGRPGARALPKAGRLILDPLLADTLGVLDSLGPDWADSLSLHWPQAEKPPIMGA